MKVKEWEESLKVKPEIKAELLAGLARAGKLSSEAALEIQQFLYQRKPTTQMGELVFSFGAVGLYIKRKNSPEVYYLAGRHISDRLRGLLGDREFIAKLWDGYLTWKLLLCNPQYKKEMLRLLEYEDCGGEAEALKEAISDFKVGADLAEPIELATLAHRNLGAAIRYLKVRKTVWSRRG